MKKREISAFGEKLEYPPLLTFNFKLSNERHFLISLIQKPENLDLDKVDKLLNAANSNDNITTSVALEYIDSVYTQLPAKSQLAIFEFIKKSIAKFVKSHPAEITKIIAFYFPDDFQNELNELIFDDNYFVSNLAVTGIFNRSDKQAALNALLELTKSGSLNDTTQRKVIESIFAIAPERTEELLKNETFLDLSKKELNTLIYFYKFNKSDKDFINFVDQNNLDTNTSSKMLSRLSLIDKQKYKTIIEELYQSGNKDHKLIADLANWDSSLKKKENLENQTTKETPTLIFNKKSLYSTPFKQELTLKIAEFGKILNILKDSFGNEVLGIQLHGSLSDGHWRPTSDNDVSIVTSSNPAINSFAAISEANGTRLDPFSCGINISELDKLESTSLATLFSGVFIGDKKTLQTIQLKILQSINDDKWEAVRQQIYSLSVSMQVDKMYNRMGPFEFSPKPFKMIKKLTKVPGTRNESLQELSKVLSK